VHNALPPYLALLAERASTLGGSFIMGQVHSKRLYSRREALKAVGAGAAAAVVGGQAIANERVRHDGAHHVDVVIVGAGFAGLSAARQLSRAGKKVVVLEARDRVGGRVKAGKIRGITVDVGGMWVGPTQTRMLALIQEFGLHLVSQYEQGKSITQLVGSTTLAEGEDSALSQDVQKELDDVFARLDELSAQVPLDAPWTAPKAEELDSLTVEDWLVANIREPAVRSLLRGATRNICQSEPYQMSLLYFLFYIRSGDRLETLWGIKDAAQAFRVEEGFHGIAARLAGDLGSAVVLNSPVREIGQDDTGVTVRSNRVWRADHAVVAVPLPLSVRIAYSPALPPERDALAQRMPMGSVIKWYAAYERPFWRSLGFSGMVASDLPPGLACFDVTPSAGTPGLLAGFFDTRFGLQWTGRSTGERKNLVVERLVDWFGEGARQIVDYEDQNWPAEEWSRGCYGASMGPGVMTTVGHVIREPFGRIHWAGTETSTVWSGYAEGAIRSGERVAGDLLRMHEHPTGRARQSAGRSS
jgi:monoamine oxidase